MVSSPSTALFRLAPLLLVFLFPTCNDGGADPAPVEGRDEAAALVDVLAGKAPTPGLRAELSILAGISSDNLVELAAAVASGGSTPADADSRYHGWLSEMAADRGLTPGQLQRLLAGVVGGRYR